MEFEAHPVDLVVIVLVMVLVTLAGQRLSGNTKTLRDFFNGGGDLPWWVVSTSIIATLVSAVTFISVPAAVFAPGGNLTYFQVVLGLAAGKIAVGVLLAKPFYDSQGPSTTYEYISARLDANTGEFSMLIGLLLGVINSGVKLLTAALVLDVMVGWGISWCALFVVSISVLWSALAGIKTVIWTDFVLFIFFSLGALFMLIFIGLRLDQALYEGLLYLDGQAKLVLFDFSVDPEVRYTIWAGVLGGVALNIAQATTQGTWQRVKACRSAVDAQKAYNWAAVCYLVHLIILGVGLALVLFYAESPLPGEFVDVLQESPDRIFPYFLITEMPVGLSGLFIAAIFAAAISTLDSSLTETSDLTVRHIYKRWINPDATENQSVQIARLSLMVWGMVFLGVSILFNRYSAEGLLNLTFQLPNYVYGSLLGTILLARFGVGRFRSFLVGFAGSCVVVLLLIQYEVAFFYWCPLSGLTMYLIVWILERSPLERTGVVISK